ncbi:allophanate hydrolase [Actibacterium mucosum KCTC 23349]|uniref:Allophanate hydrolase n=1 Tax=Actibacterium mucosum KCTC 23349 TaxID=1454373 RepID=A0A037ZJS2_9RHOB|nr:allophanate hydrolase [Actibacterium mucosum]KAJ56343.1 allophanate hydrolase [Actibacterium mucosum KCTC 23349]
MRAEIPLTLTSLHGAYAKGTTPSEIIEQVYARIEDVADPGIFLHLFAKEDLLAQAEALGDYNPEKALFGVPFVIKDNIDVAGAPTTAACPDFAYVPEKTAFVVQKLLDAGALLIGKTNLDQFATGLVGVRTPYGAPKNAIDPDIVPGGSSGGSGVAVAHGIATFSLGTDTAGSGRVPAALNNIVGLKPTLGALSATGMVPACRTLDTISIFALTVSDAYAAYAVAAVYDPADSYACAVETPSLVAPPSDLIIGIPSAASIRFEGDAAQDGSFTATVEALKATGATIREIDFTPLYDIAEMLYFGPWVAERYVATEDLITNNPDALFPVTRKIIGSAVGKTAADAFKGYYKLKELANGIAPLIDACDALCVPSIPTFASVADLEADPMGPNNMLGTYTNFVNLMNLCAITAPTPARPDGRPGSVTFIAEAGADAKVAALATQVEAWGDRKLGGTDWTIEPAQLPSSPAETVIRVAVCGAHMSGLPLNHTLTERGARFVKTDATAPDYSFFALPGSGIARPGLVRTTPGSGASVALELWDMPVTAFGSFMKTIPAPLGIGTLTLADGDLVQGFLCEAFATEAAEDISAIADWRKYLAVNA